MLDLGDLVDMLQADRSYSPHDRIPNRRTTCASLALLPIVVVHWPWYIPRTPNLAFGGCDAGSGKKKCCCGRGAEREVEGAVRPNGDACGYRCAGVVMCCACVELLNAGKWVCNQSRAGWEALLCRNPCSSHPYYPAPGRRVAMVTPGPRRRST
jgi:hypothetical protein